MEMIKMIFKKIGDGLLLGIGIGITAGFIITVISMNMTKSLYIDEEEELKQISITQDHEVNRNGVTVILGNIKNNSKETLSMLKLKVDLFDQNGTFVEQCDEYIHDLHSGKQTNFKVSCKNCDSNKTVEHSSYKIYVAEY